MAKAEKKDNPQAGEAKTGDDKPKMKRTNFSEMWPEDAAITLNVEENPKKEGSAARERFQHYSTRVQTCLKRERLEPD